MDLGNLRYQHIERALAGWYGISHSDMKAFKARIRHLRNLGVPSVEKVGKGTQLTYTRRHLWEIFIALELTKIGISPATAALSVDLMSEHFDDYMVQVDCRPRERLILIYSIAEFGPKPDGVTSVSMMLMSAKEYIDAVKEDDLHLSYLVIELSAGIRGVEGWIS